MVYAWKSGAQIKADPVIAGKMCEKLEASGSLTAKALLDANRPADAPLHGCFEWDDGVAAEAYREGQARHIINCLVVQTEGKEPVRAFFNIVRTESTYQHIETILKSEDDTARLLKTALNELLVFQKKYGQLKELAPVFEAVEQLQIPA